MAFFAIMNPLSNLPVFLSLTADDDVATRRKVARNALILAFTLIVVFALTGKFIFEVFGITLPALRITGGALVFLIGFHMVQGGPSKVQHPSDADKDASKEQQLSVAISPLGMPLLAGPGTIATAMNLSADANYLAMAMTILAFAVLCLITYGIFRQGQGLANLIGQNLMGVVTRLMGLILAVIGAQMLIAGLTGAFPVLAR